jgi:hypothetical protein
VDDENIGRIKIQTNDQPKKTSYNEAKKDNVEDNVEEEEEEKDNEEDNAKEE